MDIRNWFSPKGSKSSQSQKSPKQSSNKSPVKEVKKKKKRRIIDSDEDEDFNQTKTAKTSTNGMKRQSTDEDFGSDKKQKRKKNVIASSDEECVIESDSESPSVQRSPRKHKKSVDAKKTATKDSTPLKAVTVSEFFGSAPVQRLSKKAVPKTPLPDVKTESNHEDSDFSKTLLQLDQFMHKSSNDKSKGKKDTKPEKTAVSPKKKEKDQEVKKEPSPEKRKEKKDSSPEKGKDQKKDLKRPSLEMKDEDSDEEIGPTPKKKKPELKESKTPAKTIKEEKKISPPKKKSLGKAQSKALTKMEITPPVEKKKPTVIEAVPEKKTSSAKKGNAALYFSYLNRQGPTALGSKEIPEGERDCLKGKTFLITGVLESIERDEAKELIEKHGGKLMTTLSKNTNYIVIGRDAGVSKLDKAVKLGTTQLDEDGLFDLIRTSPGTGPKKALAPVKTSPVKSPAKGSPVKVSEIVAEEDKPVKSEDRPSAKSKMGDKSALNPPKSTKSEDSTPNPVKGEALKIDENKSKSEDSCTTKSVSTMNMGTDMWVDRYKPTSLKRVIGQQGASSNANKLLNWLKNWRKHTKNKKPAVAGRWGGGSGDGSGFKAALLSGPPGVGKTTTAQLVCKELGFDFIELNASDTRSKKCLQSVVSELLLNKSLMACFKGNGKGSVTSNHAIIMDEVDGMAGNEDRGGVQELISLIKASKIPVICICNDRNHPKIRSLSNYCFDLRFQKPRLEQIKAAMLSIAYKEGLEITPNVLNDVIIASNQDIRQVLHNLSVWCSKTKGLTEEQAKKDIAHGVKHTKMSPFDVLREVFMIGNNKKATLNDKADLFFHDYSIAPLFVQENYIHVLPTAAGNNQKKHLHLLSEAANSICIGDLIDKQIRSRSSWNLLPMQAMFASVIPGELLTGHLRQMISFPQWLGKNSNRNHMSRILQELQMHMRMRITGDKTDVAMDYLPVLKHSLTQPLIEKESNGILEVCQMMNSYCLLREDFDSVMELTLWSHQKDPRSGISTKVKSAFTRAYNKHCNNSFATPSASKKKKKGAPDYSGELLGEEGEEHVSEEEGESDEDSLENNKMIKVKKHSTSKSGDSASSSKSSAKAPAKKARQKK